MKFTKIYFCVKWGGEKDSPQLKLCSPTNVWATQITFTYDKMKKKKWLEKYTIRLWRGFPPI